jgi:tRNA (pseudouridine54-N1)-methyltransferase
MRTFILYSTKGSTDPNFSLDELTKAGRIDLVARFITSSIYTSHKMRSGTRVFIVLNGPPSGPVVLKIDSSIRGLGVDERSVATWIREQLKNPTDTRSFEQLLNDVSKEGTIYLLKEDRRDINNIKIDENPIFVIGDYKDLPKDQETTTLQLGKPLSIGHTSYLSSSCVSIIHWLLDK